MKFKKIIAVIISAVLLCSAAAFQPVSAADISRSVGDSNEGLSYSVLADGTAKITRYYKKNIESYTVPEFINGRAVSAVGEYAFSECDRLKSVTLPDSVKQISAKAFLYTPFYEKSDNYVDGALYAGNHLIKVKTNKQGVFAVRENTTSIAEEALYNCVNLRGVTLPDSLTAIDERAFSNCKNITEFNIPESVDYIGTGAFASCESITSITLPYAVKNIAYALFVGCTSLEDIKYADDLKSIGAYAFQKTKIKTAVIPYGMTTVPEGVFDFCMELESVEIPDSVTKIERHAFYYCQSLKAVTIPDNVEVIKEGAFGYCLSLKSVTFSKNLKSLYYEAFVNCTSLEEITLPDSLSEVQAKAFYACAGLKNVRLPANISEFGTELDFSLCKSLKNIDFISGIKTINIEMFSNVLGFDYLRIPNGVEVIKERAFEFCSDLRAVIIPNSVKEIQNGAFFCSKLEAIFIPKSVKAIDKGFANKNTTIYGYSKSYAETFAQENGYNFVAVDALTDEEMQQMTAALRADIKDANDYFNPADDDAADHPRYTQTTKDAALQLYERSLGESYNNAFDLALDRAKLNQLVYTATVDKSELEKLLPFFTAETNEDNYYDSNTWRYYKTVCSYIQYAYTENTEEEYHLAYVHMCNTLNSLCVYNKTCGDINNDGVLSIGDVTQLQQVLAESHDKLHISQLAVLCSGDSNSTGFNINTVTRLQRVLAEYEDDSVQQFNSEIADAQQAKNGDDWIQRYPKDRRIYSENLIFNHFLGAYL